MSLSIDLEQMKEMGKDGVHVSYQGREYILELTKEETALAKADLDTTLLAKIAEKDKLQILESTFVVSKQ
jgi:hypothetical protein